MDLKLRYAYYTALINNEQFFIIIYVIFFLFGLGNGYAQNATDNFSSNNFSGGSGWATGSWNGGDANTQIRILTSNDSASEDMYFDNVVVTPLTVSDLVGNLSPFTCSGNLYQVYASPAQIGLIDIRNNSFNDLPNSPAPTQLNASGYRLSNNIAYAFVSINPSTGATIVVGNVGTTSESWGAMFADVTGR